MLDNKIRAERTEYHAELDPLQVQVKVLCDRYEPEIKALVDQRKTFVEQGKPPAMQQLDAQEDAELAGLETGEKDELAKVKQRFVDARKAVQKKFDERRKELRGDKK